MRGVLWVPGVEVNPSPRGRVVSPPPFSESHQLGKALWGCTGWAPALFHSSWPKCSSSAFVFAPIFPTLCSPFPSPFSVPLWYTLCTICFLWVLLFSVAWEKQTNKHKHMGLWAAKQIAWLLAPVLNHFRVSSTFTPLHNLCNHTAM